ncbi:hypothetical protein JAN5088_03127 [Jannaschia rubra]|uniref:Uncharacterized protein n=1 Tax=Jannaschia rubra TaxID=282197 RepID=A0A0M6XVL3_9RHOB|nr:hypothetical protein [Jannaschia rubra]CTQ34333.1 hypothetical protein JAN5088_03127 [Jannaschia rubra]SFG17643.1 hypothetical protein SAMN04488517_10310 [Jannaschia rubra]
MDPHAVKLKTRAAQTPLTALLEYICKIWPSEPERSIPDPIHQMPGLNSQAARTRPDPRLEGDHGADDLRGDLGNDVTHGWDAAANVLFGSSGSDMIDGGA